MKGRNTQPDEDRRQFNATTDPEHRSFPSWETDRRMAPSLFTSGSLSREREREIIWGAWRKQQRAWMMGT